MVLYPVIVGYYDLGTYDTARYNIGGRAFESATEVIESTHNKFDSLVRVINAPFSSDDVPLPPNEVELFVPVILSTEIRS